jgi:hypothetical protein
MSEPLVLSVGDQRLIKTEMPDTDPRGLIFSWEPPRPTETYVLAADTTVGITGWTRELRTQEDAKIDNACIQVIRKGRSGKPDVQVCEYAAPIDHYELATVVNFLGRWYAGADETEQALACIELNNGGWATQNELINRYGYLNLPPWRQEDGIVPKITQRYGWYSSRSNRRDLWIKGMRHINARQIILNSPWLIEEMTDCTWDNFLAMTARGTYGSHDDRVVTLLIAIWYAHEWSLDLDPPETDKLAIEGLPEYQRTDMSYEEMGHAWNDKFDRILGE